MDSFIPWVGGKRALRKTIYEYFPKPETTEGGKSKPAFDRYIEVFGGAAWLLFYKDKHAPFEVYNDVNGELVNLFRCVKEHPQELAKQIDFNLISRERFMAYKDQDPQYLTDIQRAARFLYLIKHSFCSNTTSFGANPRLMPSLELMEKVAQRLERVIIENNSFERVIKQYDRTGSLLYLDPPYHTTEYFYNGGKSKNGKAGNRGDGKGAGCSCGNGNDKGSCGNNSQLVFGADDHVKLRDMLVNIKGKFILSYNDDEFLRELYKDFNIHGITRSNPMTAQTGTTKDFKELIITNF